MLSICSWALDQSQLGLHQVQLLPVKLLGFSEVYRNLVKLLDSIEKNLSEISEPCQVGGIERVRTLGISSSLNLLEVQELAGSLGDTSGTKGGS